MLGDWKGRVGEWQFSLEKKGGRVEILFGKEGWESGNSLWKGRVGEWKFSLERKGGRVEILFGKEGWESGNSLWKGRVGEWKFSLERKGGRVEILFLKQGTCFQTQRIHYFVMSPLHFALQVAGM